MIIIIENKQSLKPVVVANYEKIKQNKLKQKQQYDTSARLGETFSEGQLIHV